jgi:hypothetical protein
MTVDVNSMSRTEVAGVCMMIVGLEAMAIRQFTRLVCRTGTLI